MTSSVISTGQGTGLPRVVVFNTILGYKKVPNCQNAPKMKRSGHEHLYHRRASRAPKFQWRAFSPGSAGIPRAWARGTSIGPLRYGIQSGVRAPQFRHAERFPNL